MRLYLQFIISIILASLSFNIYAWGQLGHRIVAKIAQNHLNEHAVAEVLAITGGPELASISNWADYIKSDQSPRYKKLAVLHYIRLPYGIKYSDSVKNSKGDFYKNIKKHKK